MLKVAQISLVFQGRAQTSSREEVPGWRAVNVQRSEPKSPRAPEPLMWFCELRANLIESWFLMVQE